MSRDSNVDWDAMKGQWNMKEAATVRMAKHEDLANISKCIEEAYEKYIVRIGMKPAPMLKDYNELISSGSVYVLEIKVSGQITGKTASQFRRKLH